MRVIVLIFMLLNFARAEDGEIGVVYDLTTMDVKTFENKILKGVPFYKSYYEGDLKDLSVTIVIHGSAFKFFTKEKENKIVKRDQEYYEVHDEIKKRISLLKEYYDVEFLMCEVGMYRVGLEKKDILDFVVLIPTSTIGLIDKQNEGYAYIPVLD